MWSLSVVVFVPPNELERGRTKEEGGKKWFSSFLLPPPGDESEVDSEGSGAEK